MAGVEIETFLFFICQKMNSRGVAGRGKSRLPAEQDAGIMTEPKAGTEQTEPPKRPSVTF